MRSIRSRLVLTFGACMILILGVVVAFAALKLRSQAIASAQCHIQETVRNTTCRCKAVLDQGIITAKILAAALDGMQISSPREMSGAMKGILKNAMAENPTLVATFVCERQASLLEKEKEGNEGGDCWLLLRDSLQGRHPRSLSQGKILQKQWGLETLDTNKVVVTDIFSFPLTEKEEMVFAVLVPLGEGETGRGMVGVLLAAAPLQRILEDVGSSFVNKNTKLALFSWYGTIAASAGMPDMRGEGMDTLRPACAFSLVDLQAGKQVRLVEDDVIGFRVPVSLTEVDTPWSLGMRIPRNVVLQEADTMVRELVSVGAVLVFLAILIIIYAASQIGDPICKLSEITRRVAKGNLDQEIPVFGRDEIGTLAEDFRVMLTRRKEIEGKLLQQQHNLSVIFEKAPVGMVLFNSDLRVMAINREAASLIGCRASMVKDRLPGELLQCASLFGTGCGCGDSDLCAACLIRSTLGEVIRTGQAVHGRAGRFVQESGSGRRSLWLEINADSIEVEEKLQVILTVVNATAHHTDHEKLEANEKLLTTLLDRLPVGMVLIDACNHTISRVNPYATSMIGTSAGEILGMTCHHYICPAERGKCPITDLGKEVEETERILLTALGYEIPIIKTVVPVTLEGTEYLLEVFVDISDIKEMESALRRAKQAAESSLESAEGYAAELEIANRELDKALIAARQASVAKSEFLANMSHEIRTPMNGIIGFTDILMGMKLPEQPHEFLTMIKHSADRLLRLVNDILDFSKVEAGHLDLECRDFTFRSFLDEVLSVFWVQARDKGLNLLWQVDEDVPARLCGDSGRLGQILINLVGNAIKFTDRGVIEVAVHLQSQEQGEVKLHITVKDSGIGILAEKQEEIFEKFAQADGSHTRRYGGTGLGLAISGKLVALMGGRIWVESNTMVTGPAGESSSLAVPGSLFHFTVALSEPLSLAAVGEAVAGEGEQRLFTGFPAVLLAEDDEISRLFVEELLKAQKCRVVSVKNGQEALDVLKKDQIDIVLMDIQMPEMDGIRAVRRIREGEKESGQHIPVVALTAHAREEQRNEYLFAGMDDYLAKPLDVAELLAVMKKYLEG
ncbi:MAG: response regulator [Proteobacteria bacterium]|nr:response regulator [Pseudomonadota bacterium]MBU1058590.1 response regulator [Pseudomonadota bacterium]